MKPETVQLETIWDDYGKRLRRFLLARVSRPEDADDLTQEILIKVHKNLSQLKEADKIQSWLFQIARNALTDHYRKSRVSHFRGEAQDGDIIFGLKEEKTLRHELAGCLEPFLKQLPHKYREAVVAADLNGVPQKQLAEEWGLSYSALKSRVQRGRVLLKDLFFQCCSYEVDGRGRILSYKSKRDCC